MTDYLNRYKKGSKTPHNRGGGSAPRPGDIWWVSNLDGVKDRPILILSVDGDTVTFRKCTSQASAVRSRDVIIEYEYAGLDKETYVDPEVRTGSKSKLVRKLGELSDYDRPNFGL